MHQPLGPADDHGHPIPLAYQGAAVPKRMNQLGAAGEAVPGRLQPKDDTGVIEYHSEGSRQSSRRSAATTNPAALRQGLTGSGGPGRAVHLRT